MGLANYQADSSEGFGIYQISAIKFELHTDGHLKFLDHMDVMVEPDAELQFKDPRPGAGYRKRFYADYAMRDDGKPSACFEAYERVMLDPKIGFHTHYFYQPLNPYIRDQDQTPRFRPYSDHEEDTDALRSAIKSSFRKQAQRLTRYKAPSISDMLVAKAKLFDPPKKATLMVYEYLSYQRHHYEHLSDTARMAEIDDLRTRMLEELAENPWLIEQIDECEAAANAMGLTSRQKLLDKAATTNPDGTPLNYHQAAETFSKFCEGSEAMIGHNVMFDYAIMRRMYAHAHLTFPFRPDQIVDTLALCALDASRFGKRNRLDAIIDEEAVQGDQLQMEHDIRTMDGMSDDILKHCLSGRTRIHRLNPDKTIRTQGGHDAIEDVFITSALFERMTKKRAAEGKPPLISAAATVQEALGGDASLPAPTTPPEDVSVEIGPLLAFIYTPQDTSGFTLATDIIDTFDGIDKDSPNGILSNMPDRGGIVVNLQKIIPSLAAATTYRRFANEDYANVLTMRFSAAGGFRKLLATLYGEKTAEWSLSPYDMLDSAPCLRWDNPNELSQDIEILAAIYHFVSSYGSKVRFERNGELVDIKIGAPVNGREDGLKRAHGNLRMLYATIQNAHKAGLFGDVALDTILKHSIEPAEQRACVKIRRDAFVKAYEAEETKLKALLAPESTGADSF